MSFEIFVAHGASAGAATPSVTLSPSGNYTDGQSISVSVGPNSYFTPHAGVKILECADPGGLTANLPTDNITCDGNTIQGDSVLVANNGSFSESNYQVYALPNATLGEQSNAQPVCNQTHACVLYVGQNQNDFTAPKVFSAPFLISPSSGSGATTSTAAAATGSSAGSTTTTAVAPAASSAVSVSGDQVTSAASVSGSLADTGPAAELTWLVLSGLGLLLTGAIGRRIVLRGAP
ncbi:MAG: hypothetical protein ACLQU9_11785 [Acidimicrobiales bacterium]